VAQEKREVWMNKNKYIQGLQTPSVPSVHGFQVQYLSEALFYMDDLLDFYKEKHWRRLRWPNYICHAPFSSSSEGHAAGPVKAAGVGVKEKI
ncbi:6833_t:CDS:2, partial [Entrophospora sp. SA101]